MCANALSSSSPARSSGTTLFTLSSRCVVQAPTSPTNAAGLLSRAGVGLSDASTRNRMPHDLHAVGSLCPTFFSRPCKSEWILSTSNYGAHAFFQNHQTDLIERSFIRHDSSKIAKSVKNIINKNKVKVIFDFDDVLSDNTKEFKKHMFSSLEKAGVKRSISEKYYKQEREKDYPFSLKTFLVSLLKKEKIKKVKLEELYEKIIDISPKILNKKLIRIAEDLGKDNCYLVTNGERKFQEDKLKKSGVENLFSEVSIVPGSKKKIVEKICENNKDSKIIFIDDKVRFFEDIDMEKCKNLKTILFDKNGLKNLVLELKNKDK